MTEEQATKLLRENDWCKFSDARELLLEAAAIGAKETMESIEPELRRLHAENAALKAKLAAQSMAVFRFVTTEREACAKVCDRRAEYGNDAEWCAERIRARGGMP